MQNASCVRCTNANLRCCRPQSIKSKGNELVNGTYNPNPQRHPIPPLNDDTYVGNCAEMQRNRGRRRAIERGMRDAGGG